MTETHDITDDFDAFLHELWEARDEYERAEQEWQKVVDHRDSLMRYHKHEYVDPVQKLRTQRELLVASGADVEDIAYFDQKIAKQERDCYNRENFLWSDTRKAIQVVQEYLPVYMNARVKFRKARSKFLTQVLGQEYF